jgi:hypothetical protein
MLLYIHNDALELWVTVFEKAVAGTNMSVRDGGITDHTSFPGKPHGAIGNPYQ